MNKKKYTIDEHLSKLVADFMIASEHIKTALPDLRVSPYLKIGESDYIECMGNTIDAYINDLNEIRDRRAING